MTHYVCPPFRLSWYIYLGKVFQVLGNMFMFIIILHSIPSLLHQSLALHTSVPIPIPSFPSASPDQTGIPCRAPDYRIGRRKLTRIGTILSSSQSHSQCQSLHVVAYVNWIFPSLQVSPFIPRPVNCNDVRTSTTPSLSIV